MSLGHSPSIATNGLVLCLDAANYKSFKGEDTTNVVSDASTMSGWTSYENGNDGTFTTEFGTTGYRIINRGSWNGIYKGITLPSAGTYTVSAWFRYWGGAADNIGASVYTSGGGISDTAAYIDKTKIGVWQRISMTRTYSTTSLTFYIISFGGTYGGSNSTWEVTMPQIEQKSYVTNFVNGTRGTTVATGGGWADLSGTSNHGELVNGVSYDSSNGGSLVFDGLNDRINLGFSPTLDISSSITIEGFIYPTAYKSGGGGGGMIITKTASYYTELDGNSGKIRAYFYGLNSPGYHSGNAYVPLNTWTHYAVVRDSTSDRIVFYINGKLDRTVTSITGSITVQQSYPVTLGSYVGSNYEYTGRIASGKIYNRALTALEIEQNFNATRGRYGI